MSSATPHSHYVHGSSPEEQRRLDLMNDILNRACLRELGLRGDIDRREGERILDVGCGLARFSREMARAAGTEARVLAVERDERQIAAALASPHPQVELRQGDACDLPLRAEEWASFDLAWARFVLEHVSEPERVVAGMVRALRPGGRIVLCDDDHDLLRLDPPAPRFLEVWGAYQRTYSTHGNDPLIGRRLPRLIHDAGARPVRNTWVFFGSCAGAEDFEVVVANCRGIIAGAREQIEKHMSSRGFDAGLAELDAWSKRADASFWLPLAWAEGRKPGA